MSEENVEMVRSMYDAWNEGDIDAVLGHMDTSIRIDYAGGAFPGMDDRYEGHEGARRYWRDLLEPWASLRTSSACSSGRTSGAPPTKAWRGYGQRGWIG